MRTIRSLHHLRQLAHSATEAAAYGQAWARLVEVRDLAFPDGVDGSAAGQQ